MSTEIHHPPKEHSEVILDKIHEFLNDETEIHEDYVLLPKWNMKISPEIEQLENHIAILNFYVYMPEWDEPLFECCASTNQDIEKAFDTSICQFVFGFMDGILAMQHDDEPMQTESEFAGKKHLWNVYKSNSVGLGEEVKTTSDDVWNLLREHIVKRLGNQAMTYVKVYASKCIGNEDSNIIGEVRINDVPSRELSDMMAEVAENWNIEQFASIKMFFFIKQDPQTKLPNRYAGASGRADFTAKVKEAMELYSDIDSQEKYDNYQENLGNILGDNTLAQEIIHFLPEIAAEDAFSEIKYTEDVIISVEDSEPVNVYKNQLNEYYPLTKMFFSLLQSNVFGEKTNDIYRLLVGNSAIYNVVQQLNENGTDDLSNCALTTLNFNPSGDFEIR